MKLITTLAALVSAAVFAGCSAAPPPMLPTPGEPTAPADPAALVDPTEPAAPLGAAVSTAGSPQSPAPATTEDAADADPALTPEAPSATTPTAPAPAAESVTVVDDEQAPDHVGSSSESTDLTEPADEGPSADDDDSADASPQLPARADALDPNLGGPYDTHPAEQPDPQPDQQRDLQHEASRGLMHSAASLAEVSPLARSIAPAAALAQQAPDVITKGHMDLIEVTRDGNGLRIMTKDDTGAAPVFREPNSFQIRVPNQALTDVPAGFGFLGAAGSKVYLLPQTQNRDLVWPGWSTERLSGGQLVGDSIELSLAGAKGPGNLVMFTTDQFGTPSVQFDGADAGRTLRVPIRTHTHTNWSFSSAGTYEVTFEVRGEIPGEGISTARATYVFLVGDTVAPVPPGAVAPPSSVPAGQGGSAAGAAPTNGSSSDGGSVAGSSTGGSPSAGASAGSAGGSAAASTGGAAMSAGGRLASTGVSHGSLARLALLLATVGAAAVMGQAVARRRRHGATG